jgi:hypothetical protein
MCLYKRFAHTNATHSLSSTTQTPELCSIPTDIPGYFACPTTVGICGGTGAAMGDRTREQCVEFCQGFPLTTYVEYKPLVNNGACSCYEAALGTWLNNSGFEFYAVSQPRTPPATACN